MISSPEEKRYSPDFLYIKIVFLYEKMGEDMNAIGEITDHLNEYDKTLGNDANPKYLQTLKGIIGICLQFICR